jgi:hypothetical protein
MSAPRPTCHHLHPTGKRCGSPALRGEQFCFFHYPASADLPRPARTPILTRSPPNPLRSNTLGPKVWGRRGPLPHIHVSRPGKSPIPQNGRIALQCEAPKRLTTAGSAKTHFARKAPGRKSEVISLQLD